LLDYLDERNSICWIGGNRLRERIDVFREKAIPLPLCPPIQTDNMPGLNVTGIKMLSVKRIQ